MNATPAQVQRKLDLLTTWHQKREGTLSRERKDFYEEICQHLANWLEKYEVPYRYDQEQHRYVEVINGKTNYRG